MEYQVLRHSLADRVPQIGWFPDRISIEGRRWLYAADCQASEVRLSGIDGRDDRYDDAQKFLKLAAFRCLGHIGESFLLFRTLPKYAKRTKVRTYKGVFPEPHIAPSDLLTEIERARGGESIIGGAVVVQAPWWDESWAYAAAYQRNVLLVGGKPGHNNPNRIFVGKIMDSLEGEDVVWIDYPRLVLICRKAGYGVLRRGGDAGETFVNLTLFGESRMLNRFDREVEIALGPGEAEQ